MSDWEWYRERWAHAKPSQLLGDCSIKLISNGHVAPLLIAEHFPNAKFLVCLRDPVERLFSHYWHDRGRNSYAAPRSFEEALAVEKFVRHSRYAEQLEAWLDRFPLDRFHFVLDIDREADSSSTLRAVYEFLEVKPDFVPSLHDSRVNPPARKPNLARSLRLTGARLRSLPLAPVLRGFKSTGMTRMLYSTMKYMDQKLTRRTSYPLLSSVQADEARHLLIDDIESLEKLLGRDLSAWRHNRAQ